MIIMVFVYSKTIINKLDEAHGLIITYPEFEILKCKSDEDRNGIRYEIYADAYLDYALGVCDAMNIEYDFDYVESDGFEHYKLHIYLKDE